MKVWIARDTCGTIWAYVRKPVKKTYNQLGMWSATGGYIKIDESDLPEGVAPKWEDTEPIEVELIIKAKKRQP